MQKNVNNLQLSIKFYKICSLKIKNYKTLTKNIVGSRSNEYIIDIKKRIIISYDLKYFKIKQVTLKIEKLMQEIIKTISFSR